MMLLTRIAAGAARGRAEIGVNVVNAQQVVRRVSAGAKAVVAEHEIGVIFTFDEGGETLHRLLIYKRRMAIVGCFNQLPGGWSGSESVSGQFAKAVNVAACDTAAVCDSSRCQ